jgi:Uma2 family endonuclease
VVLLIEISDSTLRYDLDVKARLYATHGIPEYWVVDLVNRLLVRHRGPTGQAYSERDERSAGALPLAALAVEIEIDDLL